MVQSVAKCRISPLDGADRCKTGHGNDDSGATGNARVSLISVFALIALDGAFRAICLASAPDDPANG